MKNQLKLKKVHWLVSLKYPFVNVVDVDDDLSGWADYLAAAIAHAELRLSEKAEPENILPVIKTNG
jgi:hypothetical protein